MKVLYYAEGNYEIEGESIEVQFTIHMAVCHMAPHPAVQWRNPLGPKEGLMNMR